MLDELKERVCCANQLLKKNSLAPLTWGNASCIDRTRGLIAIKPSGIPYEKITPKDIVLVDMQGNVVEGKWRPSSDLPTHIELYISFPECGGIVHTHSRWATSFAQAGKDLLPYGTTHSDYFNGTIPCTRKLTRAEIEGEYEKATGKVIVETFEERDPRTIPGVLVHSHGPFTWGTSVEEAVENAIILEELAFMNWHTFFLNPQIVPVNTALLEKHYERKHGENAYYGQKERLF